MHLIKKLLPLVLISVLIISCQKDDDTDNRNPEQELIGYWEGSVTVPTGTFNLGILYKGQGRARIYASLSTPTPTLDTTLATTDKQDAFYFISEREVMTFIQNALNFNGQLNNGLNSMSGYISSAQTGPAGVFSLTKK
jgi:hypothetical protein